MSHSMSDWMRLYQSNLSVSQIEIPQPLATATTATVVATSRSSSLVPDQGRIAKPVRRRSRASRQTPTTLLNTDIANFRAMVQHFTGGSHAPGGEAGFGLGVGSQQGAEAGGYYARYVDQLQPQQLFAGGPSSHAPRTSSAENPDYNDSML